MQIMDIFLILYKNMCVYGVLGIEPRALAMLSMYTTTELPSYSRLLFIHSLQSKMNTSAISTSYKRVCLPGSHREIVELAVKP